MLLPESWRKARKALRLRISLPPRPPAAPSALPLSPSLPPIPDSPAFSATPEASPSSRPTAHVDRSTSDGGIDDSRRRALEELALREAEEEQRLLEPVLRMLDDSIASFRSPIVGAGKNGCVSSDSRCPAAAPWNHLQQQQPPDFDDDELLPDLLVGDDNGSGPPSPALEITAVSEETTVPRCEERENLTVVIHVKAAAAGTNGSGGSGSYSNPTAVDESSALQQRRRRAAVDLVAVLDVSGSMAGSKLALLKQAMRLVVRSLGDADRLSVVAFADSARRVAALRRMTVGGRRAAMDAVNSLVCGGGTSIGDGLKEGLAVLRQRRQRNPVAAVMLLSDGRDSFTMRSPAAPPDESSAASAFPVHTFGLGNDHDAATLHGIAQGSGGTFSFVRGEGLLPEAFAQCVGGVLSVVALQAVVAVRAIGGAAELRGVDAGGYAREAVERGVLEEVELGQVYADEERDMLASFVLRAEAAAESGGDVERRVIAVASVRYVDAVTGQWMRTAEAEVAVRRPATGGGGGGNVDLRVERQRDRLAAARAMEEARRMAEGGDLGAARERLAAERRRLKGSAALKAGDRLSAVVAAEVGRLEESMWSPRRYDGAARAEGLAALASHMRQRAATREGEGGDVYRTPAMNTLVAHSRTWEGGGVAVGAMPSSPAAAGRRHAPVAAEH